MKAKGSFAIKLLSCTSEWSERNARVESKGF